MTGSVSRPYLECILSNYLRTMFNFACDQYGRVYMFQRGLTGHVNGNNTDHPVFDCSQCGRSFARHGNLEKHRRSCTDGAPAAKRQRVPVAVPEFVL